MFKVLNRQVIITDDGSATILIPSLKECYHSTFGALTESMHIFIEAGLKHVSNNEKKVCILEVGLGTGLNALLTSIYSFEKNLNISYFALEPFPITEEEFGLLNYSKLLKNDNAFVWHKKILSPSKNAFVPIHSKFEIKVENSSIQNWDANLMQYNLIFFDAFAPEVQPEMWESEILTKLYNSLMAGGTLVTYCCKGEIKRRLLSCGFSVEKLPGPPGKREFIRARK